MEMLMPYGTPGLLLAAGGGYVATYYITPRLLQMVGIPMSNTFVVPAGTGALVAGVGYLMGFQGSEGLLVLAAESAAVSYAIEMYAIQQLKSQM